jgi:hypothetical protein
LNRRACQARFKSNGTGNNRDHDSKDDYADEEDDKKVTSTSWNSKPWKFKPEVKVQKEKKEKKL